MRQGSDSARARAAPHPPTAGRRPVGRAAGSKLAARFAVASLCICAAGVLIARATPTNAWRDPLDEAASMTHRAATSLLQAAAFAGDRLVVVGVLGRILVSDDHGQTWQQAAVPASADLLAVNFPSEQSGWAVGHYGVIVHSSDGGLHWTKVLDGRQEQALIEKHFRARLASGDATARRYLDEAELDYQYGPALPLLDVCFETPSTGFAVGAFGQIFRTDDGGQSWQPWMEHVDNPGFQHLTSIRRIGSALVMSSERGTVFRLDRRADRFEAIVTGYNGTYFGIVGNAHRMIAFGLRGNAMESDDGGTTWAKLQTGEESNLNAAAIVDDDRVVFATQAGRLLASGPGGARFVVAMQEAGGLTGLAAGPGRSLVATGVRGVRVVDLAQLP
ncbi:MAG TPA: YCF48-related protein [Burkholderiaceae bacterium]|nr:YCF48-related protein [Burkholderiaceae bacterium]